MQLVKDRFMHSLKKTDPTTNTIVHAETAQILFWFNKYKIVTQASMFKPNL